MTSIGYALSSEERTPREKIEEFADAGFDRVYVHQVGSDQEAFMRLYERVVLSAAVR
jgi:coenzyme F420-dependent glucose-6-phosphate dehydrogenase